ncbi:MAG TPA: hypothetical protein PKC30_02655 [Saprospiraceae bacterium]|nr:hypothetical protein [Saprospiraceae bacterium]
MSNKGGIKKTDKVERYIGRIIEKYPSMGRHFHIRVKSAGNMTTVIVVHKKECCHCNEKHRGSNFIRSNLKGEDQ